MSRRAQSKAIRDSLRASGLRRVYVLPSKLVDRILKYQADAALPTEVAAFRVLLKEGLDIMEERP